MTTTTQDRPGNRRGGEARDGLASALRVEVQLWLAVLFMAVAFGAGVLVHAMAAPTPAATPVVGSVDGGGVSGGVFAPPLSDEQVSAGLPAGHPDLGDGSTSSSDRTNDGKDGKGAGDAAGDETESGNGSP